MTDNELLELAAKAAGLGVFWGHPSSDCYDHNKLYLEQDKVMYTAREWNPLKNDGDALRLAIKLGISILSGTYKVVCEIIPQEDSGNIAVHEQYGSDEYAATRRAIVRAAAEIGMDMK